MEWIDNVPKDKLYHFIAGAAITGVFAAFPCLAPWAFVAGVVAGAAKEVYDKFGKGDASWWDFAATVIGALSMQTVIWCVL